MSRDNNPVPSYAPLVRACRSFGIGRSKAFELAQKGDLSTFRLGTRRFVYMDSLRSLPSRLGTAAGGRP